MIFKFIYRRRRRPKPSGPEIERLRAEAKAFLPDRLRELAVQKGFADRSHCEYRRIFIKNNLTNWGSCSSKGNINLNLRLMLLPEHLRDYVILHELCHLRYPNHGKEFHSLLNSLCNGQEKQLREELRGYHT